MREEELIERLNIWFGSVYDYGVKKDQQAYEQMKKLIQVDPEEIIQTVLDHIECNCVVERDDDGQYRYTLDHSVDGSCHEAVRKVLGVKK